MKPKARVFWKSDSWHIEFPDGHGYLLSRLPATPTEAEFWFEIGGACAMDENEYTAFDITVEPPETVK